MRTIFLSTLLWISIFRPCYSQLDACKQAAPFIQQLGFNQNQIAFSTSEKLYKGIVLIRFDNQNAIKNQNTKYYQDPTWDDFGYLSAITTDENGNTYVIPSPNVNNLYNPPEQQNTILRIDALTGKLEPFAKIPMDKLPHQKNPFGLMGIFYDCSSKHLIVSTIAGSDEQHELGKVCAVSIGSKEVKVILQERDIMGVALHLKEGVKTLYLGSARKPELYAVPVDENYKMLSQPLLEFSINGLEPRGDDRIKKIRFANDLTMLLTTTMFYYNLTAPSDTQQSRLQLTWDIQTKRWVLARIE